MISFIRKYLFKNSEKNPLAPQAFLVLVFYTVASGMYAYISFEDPAVFYIRITLSVCKIIVYLLLERSRIPIKVLAFLTPSTLIAFVSFGSVYFGGDFLIFTYTIGAAMISLAYMKPRSLATYIAIVSVLQFILLFILGQNMLGESFSMTQNYVNFITMIAVNILIYVFCKAYTQATRARKVFLSSMSHEIRTPMNAIIGMTTIGKSAKDLTQAHHALGKIEEASTHLLGIINDVLDMSKIDSGKFELSLEAFNFEKMFQRVKTVIALRIEEKSQNFEVNIDENIPQILIGDDQRLAQVLTNLLGNAIKFTPNKGNIRLDARLSKEEKGICTLQIEVTDSGIGISENHQKDLFKAFNQAESDTTRKYGGTGLGLSITKNIVEMMDGEIWVESKYGQGSLFAFTVKIKRGEPENADNPSTLQSQDNSTITFEGKHLLLAEDVEINREIVVTLLEPTKIKITCAENGLEAVSIFNEMPNSFDMIFMDLQMPKMGGLEATQRIRALEHKNSKNIPIIAMTANVFREDVEKCLEVGMNGHVGKPLDFDEVIDVLKNQIL